MSVSNTSQTGVIPYTYPTAKSFSRFRQGARQSYTSRRQGKSIVPQDGFSRITGRHTVNRAAASPRRLQPRVCRERAASLQVCEIYLEPFRSMRTRSGFLGEQEGKGKGFWGQENNRSVVGIRVHCKRTYPAEAPKRAQGKLGHRFWGRWLPVTGTARRKYNSQRFAPPPAALMINHGSRVRFGHRRGKKKPFKRDRRR